MPADISDTRGQLLRRFKILRRDGLQYQRHLLALVAALHLTLGVGRFIFDVFWNKSGHVPPELKLLDLLSVVLTVVARLVWAEQLRLQHRFLCFVRPSRGYRWAMYGVAAATTVPAFALHFPIIQLSAGKGRVIDNVLQTKLQLATWIATCCYYFHIVRKYMLGFEDGTYEPVATSSVGEHGSLSVDAVEESPEALTPLSHNGGLESPLGRLELAYSLQRAADSQEGSRRTRTSSRLAQATEQSAASAATTAQNEPTGSGSVPEGQMSAEGYCPTVAQFDYVCPKSKCLHNVTLWPLTTGILLTCTLASAFCAIRFAVLDRQQRISSRCVFIICPFSASMLKETIKSLILGAAMPGTPSSVLLAGCCWSPTRAENE